MRCVPRSPRARAATGLRACFLAAKPHWVQRIEDVELAVEDSLSWQCRAGGKPTPSYRWLKDGAALALEVRATRHAAGCLRAPGAEGAGVRIRGAVRGQMGKIKPPICVGRDFRLNLIGER